MHDRFAGRVPAFAAWAQPRTAAVVLALILAPAAAAAQEEGEAEPAPGELEVDPEAAERALERTLTAEGALLLPRGVVEIEPSVRYERDERDEVFFVRDPTGAVVDFGEVGVERDETTLALDARLGLPFDAQIEVGLPFRFVSSERTAVTAGLGRDPSSASGNGIGDVTVGVAKTLLREQAWRPDVIARVNWDTATARETDGDLLLGESFHEVEGSLTLLKRQDPLAFVVSGFYETVFEKDDVDPGDSYGFGLNAVLAASPETSLSLGFQQSFSKDVEVDGRSIPNSGTTQGVLTLGASSILGDGVLLNVTLGVGLDDDATDYFLRVGLPIRIGRTFF